jgi:uncharacterized protein
VRRQTRIITPVRPVELDVVDGLAYSLWMPEHPPRGGVVILHGAGSCKENHHDFARVAVASGLAALAFDQRGHGASEGPMDGRVVDDIVAIADLLRARTETPGLPIALRGSSMGGYLAIVAAAAANARAVVSICPASAEGLRRGLASERFGFHADIVALDQVLAAHDLETAVKSLTVPLLLLHAEGDEQVPVEHSRELARSTTNPHSRLIAVPGGHHRSVQHDAELQAVTLRWLDQAFR